MISMGKKLMAVILAITATSFVLHIMGARNVGRGNAMAAWAQETASLTTGDCIKCHSKQPEEIKTEGGEHGIQVDCLACHVGHPPLSKAEAMECLACHEDKPHYDLENCSGCHTNAHTPLKVKIGDDVTKPCLTCHSKQGKEVKEAPSAHSEQACSFCHTEHKEIQECLTCHDSHSPDVTASSGCLGCHSAHRPLVVAYSMETPSKSCTPCHKKAHDQLQVNVTQHSDKPCAYCHRNRHKMVPICETCHGAPHPPAMHKKFPACKECHNTAHYLNQLDIASTIKSPTIE